VSLALDIKSLITRLTRYNHTGTFSASGNKFITVIVSRYLMLKCVFAIVLVILPVRQTTMAQMSSQADTNALIAATVHGKGLKPSQPSPSPSSVQPPTISDQRMPLTSGPPGYSSIANY